MKKIMLFAAACVVLAACTKNIDTATPEKVTAFKKGQKVTLTVNAGEQTKVTSSLDGTTGAVDFKWETGDKIKVTVGTESAEFTLSSGAGTSTAEFTGTMPEGGSSFDVQYPYEAPTLASQAYSSTEAIPHDMMLATATDCTIDTPFSLTAQNAALRLNLYGGQTVSKIVVTNISSAASYTLSISGGKAIGTTSVETTPFFIVVPAEEYSFSIEIFDNSSNHIDKVITKQNFTAGEILNMPALRMVDDALPGFFSMSADKKVRFSKGNLQATYNSSTSSYTWGFATTQYDYVGNAAGNTTINSQTNGAKVDLFGWVGASSSLPEYGINTSANNYYGTINESLKKDWGTSIDNSGTWYTLSFSEWLYLFYGRPNAYTKFGKATVAGVNGIILISDSFTDPMTNGGSGAFVSGNSTDFTNNVYASGGNWEAMESSGAVFLPAAGRRTGSSWSNGCSYWSSTSNSGGYNGHHTDNHTFDSNTQSRRYFGLSVRLVTTVQ